mmetsp:Transcript_30850/g.36670  ORF Transcript_30850/g.36670 Transcript_30850/m.36670 type:complete len:153 (-) Transcript_30850:176-634(-)
MKVKVYHLLLVLVHQWYGRPVTGEATGWDMTDRFSGFRYEIFNAGLQVTKQTIQATADQLACFGWAQNSKKGTIVGEVRCSKRNGAIMKIFLAGTSDHNLHTGTQIHRISIKDYEDTKIKLHFSHFKILGNERETCFRDEPHQCDNLSLPLL